MNGTSAQAGIRTHAYQPIGIDLRVPLPVMSISTSEKGLEEVQVEEVRLPCCSPSRRLSADLYAVFAVLIFNSERRRDTRVRYVFSLLLAFIRPLTSLNIRH